MLDSRLDELWVVVDFALVPDLEGSLTRSDGPILQYSRVENDLIGNFQFKPSVGTHQSMR